MLSGNPFKVSRCRCPFRDPGLLSALGLVGLWRSLYDDSFRLRRLFYAHDSHWNSYARFMGRRARSCGSQRRRVSLLLHRPRVGVRDGIAQADIVLGRLQEGLRRHAIIRKPRFFCKLKIPLYELSRRASDLAYCARALKDMVAGITLLLWQTRFATPSMSIRSHGPIQ